MRTSTVSNVSLSQLILNTQQLKNICKPIFFRLNQPIQKTEFNKLIEAKPFIQVYDYIVTQVEELVKCLQPTIVFLPPTELAKIIESYFANNPSDEYGVWVYYPWAEKLVHILDEKDFAIVRTNRNKHKITAEEQDTLADKKIGVMGLSVGQSVALTLAIERGFGELRIADFDELDLSNLNRIRTGLHNLKISKTVVVAREIAEIDPYLNVICYNDGINYDNLAEFLLGLDLLIDECDSFDIKINSRKIAKTMGIPVLMEGSDRGTIDIERFDLEPNREILHGMVNHLDMSKYNALTTLDERLPYISAVTGIETLSPRMKASAIEIMSTITTWPQLASAVTYGGGITADLARKILLGNLSVSGRFFIDIDDLITDKAPEKTSNTANQKPILLSINDIENYLAIHFTIDSNTENVSESILNQLIEAASKAPSGGNSQPWRWHYQKGKLHLFLEENAAGAYLDPDYISSYQSLGSAIANLMLLAASINLEVNWQITPQLAPQHLAWFSFTKTNINNQQAKELAQQINLRHTNRKIGNKQEILVADYDTLNKLVTETPGAKLIWLTDPEKTKDLAAIATQTDLLRMFITEAHEDFITKEMRWDLTEVNEKEDGIGIHTLDLSNNDQIGLRLIKDKRAVNFLQQINGGSAFKRLTMHQFMSSNAVGLITMPDFNVTALINAGLASQKLWLGVTALNLQMHPVNVPLIFFYKNTVQNSLNVPLASKLNLSQAETKFKKLFNLQENEQPVFMFRLFNSSSSPERTIRKPITKILSFGRA